MEINRELADRLAKEVRAQPKECWLNSVMALLTGNMGEGAVYVEGIVAIMDGAIPIEHGWLEVEGKIVDVTMTDIEAEHYHPVCRYDYREVMKQAVHERSVLPLYLNDVRWKVLMRRAELDWWGTHFEVGSEEHTKWQAMRNSLAT